MTEHITRTVTSQIAITLIAAGVAFMTLGEDVAKSAFWGGMLAVANSVSLLKAVVTASKNERLLFPVTLSGLITRFLIILIMFAVAFGVLHLPVVPSLVVFAIAQLTYGWGLRHSYKDLT